MGSRTTGDVAIVQGTIVHGDSFPGDFCPMMHDSKETIIQWDFCPTKLLQVKRSLKLIDYTGCPAKLYTFLFLKFLGTIINSAHEGSWAVLRGNGLSK